MNVGSLGAERAARSVPGAVPDAGLDLPVGSILARRHRYCGSTEGTQLGEPWSLSTGSAASASGTCVHVWDPRIRLSFSPTHEPRWWVVMNRSQLGLEGEGDFAGGGGRKGCVSGQRCTLV